MKIIAIIQARMGSTRLPGKVLLNLAGEPMLVRVVNRISRSETLNNVVVATTVEPSDTAIVDLCGEHGWSYFRGNEEDVLDRYYQAAEEFDADGIVRITSDCPLIEPQIIDQVVRAFLERQPDIDYVSNTAPERTFPRGLDTEVMSFEALEQAWHEDDNPAWREHVTTYIRRHPELFKTHGINNDKDLSHMRWTVDTHDDLAFVRCIYAHFEHDRFTWLDVLTLLSEHSEWLEMNQNVEQKTI